MRKLRDLANLMNDTRIYTLGRLQMIILSLFGVMAIGAIVLGIFSKKSDAWLVSIVILFILGTFGGVIAFTARNVGLITGREGVIYAGQGYTLYTPWNNIKKVTNRFALRKGLTITRFTRADRPCAGYSRAPSSHRDTQWSAFA